MRSSWTLPVGRVVQSIGFNPNGLQLYDGLYLPALDLRDRKAASRRIPQEGSSYSSGARASGLKIRPLARPRLNEHAESYSEIGLRMSFALIGRRVLRWTRGSYGVLTGARF